MKKIWLLSLVSLAVLLSACEQTPEINEPDDSESISYSNTFLSPKSNSRGWKVQMQKPALEDMENFNALLNWYIEDWTMDYSLTEADTEQLNYCFRYWNTFAGIYSNDRGEELNTLKPEEVKVWNTFTLTWTHNFSAPNIYLSDEDQAVLWEKWWTIIPIDQVNLSQVDYTETYADSQVWTYQWTRPSEEWIRLYGNIGWWTRELDRNPANTILITNDLLLHSFHKLFDNTLKYYEQTVARVELANLSKELYDKFSELYNATDDPELKETYEFLKMYWAIPSIILAKPDLINIPQYNEEYWFIEDYNSTDEQIYDAIMSNENINKYLANLEPASQKLVKEILNKIFKADAIEVDSFLSSYSPDFIVMNEIKQDYTQFTPRSHYTDNAELKTYFMAMKWLMREKFYFWDKKLTKTAMIMTANITPEEQNQLSNLSEKIKKLIWWDDDLTLTSLSNWMQENNFATVEDINNNFSSETADELMKIIPQKIQSTYYTRPSTMVIASDEAKDMTAWFVFFGEKFTLDSYLFDLETAGSAEKEYQYMPNKQTALIVPEILENNSDAAEIVNVWMTTRMAKSEIQEGNWFTQFSSYNKVKTDAIEKLKSELSNTTVISSMYHKRLNMLWYLINEAEENAPYFKLDPIYRLKNLVTYMWSYTELKHDTLLYVKQNYAELWWWGNGECWIWIDPPALPVPKWYVEADLDIINQLIELNNEVKTDFSDVTDYMEDYMADYILSNFTEFDSFLNHIEDILIKQMDNEIISDEDFERMRTAYNTLWNIVFPFVGNASQKEMRSALIADIFTSEWPNPLYEAIGRPAVMLVMIDDINWKRIARGPVFTHYEFYDSDDVLDANGSRLNDIQWQAAYDSLSGNKYALSSLSKKLKQWLTVK